MPTYTELLLDPRWQKKRLQILSRDDWKCVSCSNAELTLHVHHLRYVKGRMPWEYDCEDLATLCYECHENWHEDKQMLDRLFTLVPPNLDDRWVILAAVAGALSALAKLRGDKSAEEFRYHNPDMFDAVVDGYCATKRIRSGRIEHNFTDWSKIQPGVVAGAPGAPCLRVHVLDTLTFIPAELEKEAS